MSASSTAAKVPSNDLYRIAAASSILVGLLFWAGAFGHITAAWPLLSSDAVIPPGRQFALLLPGGVLTITALVNLCGTWPLWLGKQWTMKLALAVNALAAVYLGYLLHRGVQDHPIGTFMAFASTQAILLGSIRIGLSWPVAKQA